MYQRARKGIPPFGRNDRVYVSMKRTSQIIPKGDLAGSLSHEEVIGDSS
jgi:hypothetical protein